MKTQFIVLAATLLASSYLAAPIPQSTDEIESTGDTISADLSAALLNRERHYKLDLGALSEDESLPVSASKEALETEEQDADKTDSQSTTVDDLIATSSTADLKSQDLLDIEETSNSASTKSASTKSMPVEEEEFTTGDFEGTFTTDESTTSKARNSEETASTKVVSTTDMVSVEEAPDTGAGTKTQSAAKLTSQPLDEIPLEPEESDISDETEDDDWLSADLEDEDTVESDEALAITSSSGLATKTSELSTADVSLEPKTATSSANVKTSEPDETQSFVPLKHA